MDKCIIIIAFISLLGCGIEQVDEGYRGIKTNWGKVVGEPLVPGLYFYNPISAGIFEMDVKEKIWRASTECFTRDTQQVNIEYGITIYPKPDQIGNLYIQFGKNWEEKLISPSVVAALKDVVGQFDADHLVSKRQAAALEALNRVKETVSGRGIVATQLSFLNLDFRDEYEHAVESKVVAVQKAAEAKNKTVQVEEEAKQKVLAAKADAEAMRIKSQALAQNKGLTQYEAVQRWNGELPKIILGNSVPIIDLNKMAQ